MSQRDIPEQHDAEDRDDTEAAMSARRQALLARLEARLEARRAAFQAEWEAQRCPKCGSSEVAAIKYGMPQFNDELRAALEAGRIVLGGCCIHGDNPAWSCRKCRHEWGRLFPEPDQDAGPGGAPDTST